MSPENALDLLDIMPDLNIRDLDIMGGEPFLLTWMPSFLHAAIKEGIMVNISSNGSFPEVMQEFEGLSPGKINIGISLEGSSAQLHDRLTGADNFSRAVASITNLISLGLDPVVKTVVNRQTMADMQDIIALLKQLGVRRFYLIHRDLFTMNSDEKGDAPGFPEFMQFFLRTVEQNPDFEINRVNASCFEKEKLPEGVRCAGGVRKLSIMPDGSVYPCNLFQHLPEFSLGNIFSDPFPEIWSSPRLELFRHFSSNRCSRTDCSNHASCTGGCPAHAFFHGYDPQIADIRCRRQPRRL